MASTSIVIELQRLASDSNTKVSEVLRKALLVATKLKLSEFKRWIEAELHGFDDDTIETPQYRIVQAEVKAMNPYRGLIPVHMPSSATEARYGRTELNNSMPELENMMTLENGFIVQKLPPEHSAVGQFSAGITFETFRVVAKTQVFGIIETVRTMILEWALKLESEGILGGDMTFSDSDKEKAAISPNIQIGTLNGVLGDVSTHSFQVGDYASVYHALKSAGVSQHERNELENILDELKKTKAPSQRKGVLQRGMDWVSRNGKLLGALATTIHGWFKA